MSRFVYEKPGFLRILELMNRHVWKQFAADFCRCGIAGWCLEILFTSVDSIAAGDWRLMGTTSLFMFPIYGMGAVLGPGGRLLDRWLGDGEQTGPGAQAARLVRRGLVYMVLIFIGEYLAGTALKALGICPWDYSAWPDNIDGVIRLGFAPLWFGTGLLFEYLTQNRSRS